MDAAGSANVLHRCDVRRSLHVDRGADAQPAHRRGLEAQPGSVPVRPSRHRPRRHSLSVRSPRPQPTAEAVDLRSAPAWAVDRAAGLPPADVAAAPADHRTETSRSDRTRIHVDSPGHHASAPAPPRLAWSGPYLFASGAGQRPYFVYTPTRYQVGTSVPLVVMLHGCSQTPRGVAVATQWNELAEEHNFIVVYPGQTLAVHPGAITGPTGEPADQPADYSGGESPGNQLDPCWQDGNGDNCWNWFLPDHQSRGAGEPAIIAGITQAVLADTAQWTIDPARVYVAGMSAGGAMAVILGATYPDLYSAVAAHSALEYQAATDIPSAFAPSHKAAPTQPARASRHSRPWAITLASCRCSSCRAPTTCASTLSTATK